MTQTEVYTNISKIIERDSKSTTYKYALLRGVIDIILENSPFIQIDNDRVKIPLGLMIEKWLMYYYPILESETPIRQINGSANLAFESPFRALVDSYRGKRGGFSAFYNDLTCKSIPKDLHGPFFNLVRSLRKTIVDRPMRYIGMSVNQGHYSIFARPVNSTLVRSQLVDIEYLIQNCGTFSIPLEYYEAFRFLGRFVNGKDSILFKWAEFSVNASKKGLSVESVLHEVLKNPVTEREVSESKKFYQRVLKKEGKVRCVWTDRPLSRYDVDHVIPFSIWKNNDLWNLLPSSPEVNSRKRDMIPAPGLVQKRKDEIIHYWELLSAEVPDRFQKEIRVALLGANTAGRWQAAAIAQLKSSCDYLIAGRGYEAWNG